MDAKTWARTVFFVNRLARYSGIEHITQVEIGPLGPRVRVTPKAFEETCRGREVSQEVAGGHLFRKCQHGEFTVETVLRTQPIPVTTACGERIELCDETDIDTVLYEDADAAILEQTPPVAEAVSDG